MVKIFYYKFLIISLIVRNRKKQTDEFFLRLKMEKIFDIFVR